MNRPHPHIDGPGDGVIVEDVHFPGDGSRATGSIVRATRESKDYGDGAAVAMFEVRLDGPGDVTLYAPANKLSQEP
jgi:hypothetical protein